MKSLLDTRSYTLIEVYQSQDAIDLDTILRFEEQAEKIIQQERHLLTLLEVKREQQVSLRRKQA